MFCHFVLQVEFKSKGIARSDRKGVSKSMDKDVSMLRPVLSVFFIGLHAMNMAAAVKVEKTEYRGWANSYRVSNGEIEVIVTSDVGLGSFGSGLSAGKTCLRSFPTNSDAVGKRSSSCGVETGFGKLRRIPSLPRLQTTLPLKFEGPRPG
jgi:hypothetical protein